MVLDILFIASLMILQIILSEDFVVQKGRYLKLSIFICDFILSYMKIQNTMASCYI